MIRRAGRVAEPAPPPPAGDQPAAAAQLGGSVQIRHVDAGSCNGCEVEIASAFGPVYDTERYGARLVASPRHADALVVTGPVTRNMAEPLRRTYEAVATPKLVVVPVDLEVAGCPPRPEAIVEALRKLTGR
jgi:Ni,Fe-hydrogenase III small subunit